jgi:uncharacterized membrane protein YkoI
MARLLPLVAAAFAGGSADAKGFKTIKSEVGIERCLKAALARKPGEMVETQYPIEPNGDASYEFDIQTPRSAELKLEVDAADGRIVEDDEDEVYQIGRE